MSDDEKSAQPSQPGQVRKQVVGVFAHGDDHVCWEGSEAAWHDLIGFTCEECRTVFGNRDEIEASTNTFVRPGPRTPSESPEPKQLQHITTGTGAMGTYPCRRCGLVYSRDTAYIPCFVEGDDLKAWVARHADALLAARSRVPHLLVNMAKREKQNA